MQGALPQCWCQQRREGQGADLLAKARLGKRAPLSLLGVYCQAVRALQTLFCEGGWQHQCALGSGTSGRGLGDTCAGSQHRDTECSVTLKRQTGVEISCPWSIQLQKAGCPWDSKHWLWQGCWAGSSPSVAAALAAEHAVLPHRDTAGTQGQLLPS